MLKNTYLHRSILFALLLLGILWSSANQVIKPAETVLATEPGGGNGIGTTIAGTAVEPSPAALPIPVPNLVLGLGASPMNVAVGETVTLTVTMTNSGEAPLTEYQVALFLPPDVTFDSGLTGGVTFSSDSGVAAATFDSLAIEGTDMMAFTVTISEEARPEIPLTVIGGAPYLSRTSEATVTLFVAGNGLLNLTQEYIDLDEGGWTPKFNAAMVSTFSGALSYEYPIAVPPGRNGLQPSLNLTYNSKRVDGITDWRASEWVGLGWNIDGIDIVRTGIRPVPDVRDFWLQYRNEFELIMNGASYRLQPANPAALHGRYYAEGSPNLYILRINDCSDDDDCYNDSGGSRSNKTTEYWLIRTLDGTEYRLGYEAQSEQVLYRTASLLPYAGPHQGYAAYRWRVDRVVDVHGNPMRYEYVECRTIRGDEEEVNCGVHHDGPDERREIASYLQRIYYNWVPDTWGGRYLTTVELNSFPNHTPSPEAHEGPTFVTRHRLNSIRVWWDSSLVQEHSLLYTVDYNLGGGVILLLTGIIPYGLGGEAGQVGLPGPTFSYQEFDNKERCQESWGDKCDTDSPNHQWLKEGFAYERLVRVDNGYGGFTEFELQHDGRSSYWGPYYNYRVVERHDYDGVSDAAERTVTTYEYQTPCYDQWNLQYLPPTGILCEIPDTPNDWGPLVGHSVVTATVGSTAQPLQVTRHEYHTQHVHYILRGRETLTQSFTADGLTLLQEVSNGYGVNDAVCRNNGLPGDVYFSCRQWTASVTHDPGTAASRTISTTFVYDPAWQGGVQYGQQTGVSTYDVDNNRLERSQLTAFAVNAGAGLVAPYVTAALDGYGNLLAASFNLYDDNQDPDNQILTNGRLTGQRTLAGLPGLPCSSPTPQQVTTVDVRLAYDSLYPGNVITTSTYAGYGTMACSNLDWHDVSPPGGGSDVRNQVTEYDANGLFPARVMNALTHPVTIDYDADIPWLPAAVTDPNDATTRYAYDLFGRLRKIARPGDDLNNPTVKYTYWDDPGLAGGIQFISPLLIEVEYKDQLQQNVRRFYDGFGR